MGRGEGKAEEAGRCQQGLPELCRLLKRRPLTLSPAFLPLHYPRPPPPPLPGSLAPVE